MYVMPRKSGATEVLPPAAAQALRALGEHLALARVRRRQSQRVWAQRLGVSAPTVIRLERGDAGASLGLLATALWLIGRIEALPQLADPAQDRGALEADVRAASRRRSARSAAAKMALAQRAAKAKATSTAQPATKPATKSTAKSASNPAANRPAPARRTSRKR